MQINLVDFLVVSLLFQHMHHKDETILPYEKAYAYKMFQYTHHEDATTFAVDNCGADWFQYTHHEDATAKFCMISQQRIVIHNQISVKPRQSWDYFNL